MKQFFKGIKADDDDEDLDMVRELIQYHDECKEDTGSQLSLRKSTLFTWIIISVKMYLWNYSIKSKKYIILFVPHLVDIFSGEIDVEKACLFECSSMRKLQVNKFKQFLIN